MTVQRLKDEMSYEEFLQWVEFFQRRPIGYRDDFRTYMLMATFGYKGKPEDVFASIKQVREKDRSVREAGRVLPKGKFLERMLNATGGDADWDLLEDLKGKMNGKN